MSDKRININEADENSLVQLPGIAQALATRIVEYRENIHPFEDIEDLAAVPGISKRMVRNFADKITVTASGSNGSTESNVAVSATADAGSDEAADHAPGDLIATSWDSPASEEPTHEQDELIELDQLQDTVSAEDEADMIALESDGPEGAVFDGDDAADDGFESEIIDGEVLESEFVDEIIEGEVIDEDEGAVVELGRSEDGDVDDIPLELGLDPATMASLDEEVDSDLSHSVDVDAILAEETAEAQEVDYEVASQFVDEAIDEEAVESFITDESSDEIDAEVEPEAHFEAAEAVVENVASPAAEPVFSRTTDPQPQPAVAPAQTGRRLDWLTALVSALLGAGLTLLLLTLLNGSLTFVTRDNATALQQTINQQTSTITDQINTITAQSEEMRAQSGLIESLQAEVDTLSADLAQIETNTGENLASVTSDITSLDDAVATLGTALATTNSEIADLQEIDAALQEVDTLLNERVDNVAGAAEEVDSFLIDLRDLLVGLKGVPEPTPADSSDDSGSDGDASPVVQPTRTPRPTPTPLAVPTQSSP